MRQRSQFFKKGTGSGTPKNAENDVSPEKYWKNNFGPKEEIPFDE